MNFLKKIYGWLRYGIQIRYDRWHKLRPLSKEQTNAAMLHYSQQTPFVNLTTDYLDPEIATAHQRWTQTADEEYLLCYQGRCTIEPKQSWVITANNEYIYQSIPLSHKPNSKESPPSLFNMRLNYRQRQYYPTVAVLNFLYRSGHNYWHFFNDILGQLALLERLGVTEDVPLVISERLAQQSFFQQALKRSSELAGRKWLAHGRFLIDTDKVYLPQNMPYVPTHFLKIQEWLQIPEAPANKNNRLFLIRNPKRTRSLSNCDEIVNICQKHGFQAIDTDGMTLDQQITLFSGTRLLVALHGAGITNINFRRNAPLALLEVFPADYIVGCYFFMAKGLNMGYDAIAGGKQNDKQQFHLPADRFEQKLKLFIENYS